MNYWLFTVTQKKVDGETLEAEDIFKQRTSDKFWGLGERAPNGSVAKIILRRNEDLS